MATIQTLWRHLRPRAAFEQCVGPQVPRLYRLAWRLSGSPHDAEDLVQETLARAYPRLKTLLALDAPGPWLARVLYNLWIDQHRRADALHHTGAPEDPDGLPGSDTPLLAAVEAAELLRAIDALPEAQRTVVLLHDAEGFTLQEAAKILDTPLGTLKSRLHRAREKLRVSATNGTFSHASPCRKVR